MKHRLQRLAQALAGRSQSERSPRSGAFPCPAASFDFDALAKEVAQGLSRREALRRLGIGLGGTLPGGCTPSGTCSFDGLW
jgi:hypothetical protein